CRAAYKLGLRLYFAATLRRGFAQRCAEHGLFQPQLLRDARGPFRAQYAIRNSLHVRQQKIDGSKLSLAGSQIHLTRPADEIMNVWWWFFELFLVALCALFANVQIGIGFLVSDGGKCEHANFEILFEQRRKRTFRRRLSCDVRVIIYDDAPRKTTKQFDLRFG